MIENQTSVNEVDLDLDSLFAGAPGADSIVTPTATNDKDSNKQNFFKPSKVNLDFLDKDDRNDDGNIDPEKGPIDTKASLIDAAARTPLKIEGRIPSAVKGSTTQAASPAKTAFWVCNF